MRKFRLFFLLLVALFGVNDLQADVLQNKARPNVIFFNMDGVINDSTAAAQVISTYYSTLERGFRQVGMPRFIMAGKNQKMILGIGGNVAIRTMYDFDGIAQNPDFITEAIPSPNSALAAQQFQIDPSPSTLYFKAIAHGGRLGPIVAYIKTDFRGYENTDLFLREAYVSVAGFLVGRNFSTFCDLQAAPATVGFEGPNSYQTIYNQMIRYTHTFKKKWKVALAAELPTLSGTFTAVTERVPQRMPDFIGYVQYAWNEGRSHVRASGLVRDLTYYNSALSRRQSERGWAAQLGGSIQMGDRLTAYFQGTYGEGISPYLQDIYMIGLDLVPNPNDPTRLQTLPMAGWIGGLQYNFNERWNSTLVYSGVRVFSRNGFYSPKVYNLAQYASFNLFYDLTESCQLGLSYSYGTRKNQDNLVGHANRVEALIQYNF